MEQGDTETAEEANIDNYNNTNTKNKGLKDNNNSNESSAIVDITDICTQTTQITQAQTKFLLAEESTSKSSHSTDECEEIYDTEDIDLMDTTSDDKREIECLEKLGEMSVDIEDNIDSDTLANVTRDTNNTTVTISAAKKVG